MTCPYIHFYGLLKLPFTYVKSVVVLCHHKAVVTNLAAAEGAG